MFLPGLLSALKSICEAASTRAAQGHVLQLVAQSCSRRQASERCCRLRLFPHKHR
jgi:hypothetical protein